MEPEKRIAAARCAVTVRKLILSSTGLGSPSNVYFEGIMKAIRYAPALCGCDVTGAVMAIFSASGRGFSVTGTVIAICSLRMLWPKM